MKKLLILIIISTSLLSSAQVKTDPSGLFINVTDDTHAKSLRRNAVSNLKQIETTLSQSPIDLYKLEGLVKRNEKSLKILSSKEPDMDSKLYYEKYNPLKEKATKTIEINKKLDLEFSTYFSTIENSTKDAEQYVDINKYGEPRKYTTSRFNYCYIEKEGNPESSYSIFKSHKDAYNKLKSEIENYKHSDIEYAIKDMESCLEKGNEYTIVVSTIDLTKLLKENELLEKVNPKEALAIYSPYLSGLKMLASDVSLNPTPETKSSLDVAIEKLTKKVENLSEYTNGGEYKTFMEERNQKYLLKIKIAPAQTTNNQLSSSAKQKVLATSKIKLSSINKVHITSEKYIIKKNGLDIPILRYYPIQMTAKGIDGKCYLIKTDARYNYIGGGSYESKPTVVINSVTEMACENL